MEFVNFPKAEIPGGSTGTRNLFINIISIDLVFEDSDKPGKTAIIVNGVWQWVDMPIAQVMAAIKKATK